MTETFIIALLTIFGSGVTSAYVTHKLNSTNADKRLRLEKLELLFNNAHDFCTLLLSSNLPWFGVMKGDYDYNKALDMQIERMPKTPSAARDAEMLLTLYFPDLKIYWERILKARDSINKVLGPFKADYKENGPSSSHELFIAPLKKALEEVEKADTDFKEQAFYVAEALSGKRFSLNY